MKRTALFILFVLLVSASRSFADGEVGPRASTAAKEMVKAINNALLGATNEKGFAAAVPFCDETKVTFPAQRSKRAQLVKIGRVSLKFRNPKNAPDKWEAEQLAQMDADFQKKDLKPRYIDKEVVDGKKYYRYMEPIRATAFCLNCHGTESDMRQDALANIRTLYPRDKAIGYQEGDLMGAVTVTIPMND